MRKKKEIKRIEYHSVIDFVNSAKSSYPQLDKIKQQGFIVHMRNIDKFYMINEKDFIPYLNSYLGI